MSSQSLFRPYIRFGNAKRFVRNYSLSHGEHNLYCMIGRETDPQGDDPSGSPYAAGDGLWPNSDQDVATPANTVAEDREFWSFAIGAQKLDPRDVSLVVPRVNWTSGEFYNLHPLFDDTVDYSDGNFYVLNSNNEIFVLVEVDDPAVPSTTEPTFAAATTLDNNFLNDGKSSILVAADGYTWRYITTIRAYEIDEIMGESWMPVPYEDTLVQPDTDPVRTRGRDDAWWILGARWVLVRSKMGAANDGSALPSGLTYRQISFVEDPVEDDGTTLATDTLYLQRNSVVAGADQLQKNSGRIIYRENRGTITRDDQQTEEIRVVIVL